MKCCSSLWYFVLMVSGGKPSALFLWQSSWNSSSQSCTPWMTDLDQPPGRSHFDSCCPSRLEKENLKCKTVRVLFEYQECFNFHYKHRWVDQDFMQHSIKHVFNLASQGYIYSYHESGSSPERFCSRLRAVTCPESHVASFFYQIHSPFHTLRIHNTISHISCLKLKINGFGNLLPNAM